MYLANVTTDLAMCCEMKGHELREGQKIFALF
jgi:hypothetical protein